MTKQFSKTEKDLLGLLKSGSDFTFNSNKYKIIKAAKPSPPSGECKTDIYILGEDSSGKKIEIKISIKQHNADFLENKMSLERAIQIFGCNAQKIIANSLHKIEESFKNDYLVLFDSYKTTEAKTLKIGWKFELLNKEGGDKSSYIELNEQQILNIYSGTELDSSKKNSYVDKEIVQDSGVANYVLETEENKLYKIQEIFDKLQKVDQYIKDKKIYFACKAINYRVVPNKWDGNRPLSVYIDWKITNNKLNAEIIMNNPLGKHANEIGENIRSILQTLKIDSANFERLEDMLDEKVRYYKKPTP